MTERYFPLFKFLKDEHANNLLEKGNIRIATLHEFRDHTLYKDTTGDENEGKLLVKNFYTGYRGSASEAHGLIPYFYPSNHAIEIKNRRFACEIDLPSIYVYCTSKLLFSGSMSQAVKEGKRRCIMIFDKENFFKTITDNLDLRFRLDECLYMANRIIEETNPDENSYTNLFTRGENVLNTAFIKPEKYNNHMEVRALWFPMDLTCKLDNTMAAPPFSLVKINGDPSHNSQIKASIKDIVELSNFCLEIDISKVDVESILSETGGMIKGYVHHIDGEDSYF